MKISWILWQMKMKQGFNTLFRFSKRGWLFVGTELFSLVTFAYFWRINAIAATSAGPLLLCAWTALFGNGCLLAEKYLFPQENTCDLLSGSDEKSIIAAIYGQILWGNLRVTTLFPLLFFLAAAHWSAWPLLLLVPISATAGAMAASIAVKAALPRLGALFYGCAALIWAAASLGALGLLFRGQNEVLLTVPQLLLAAGLLLAVLAVLASLYPRLANLWRKAHTQQNASHGKTFSFTVYRSLHRLFPHAEISKDWLLLLRNPATMLRAAMTLLCLLLCLLTPLGSWLAARDMLLVAALAIHLLCWGEVMATAWQNEGQKTVLPWLAGRATASLLKEKCLTYTPTALLSTILFIILGLRFGLGLPQLVFDAIQGFVLLAASLVMGIMVAACSYGEEGPGNLLLEQVPVKLAAVAAFFIQAAVLLLVFLPPLFGYIIAFILAPAAFLGQMQRFNRHFFAG